MSHFNYRDKVQVAILVVCFAPMVATVFFGASAGNPYIVATATGLAIASAGFALAWGTESLQFLISQALALAILAVVNVLPEYSVEVVLAYNGATDATILHYATAAMTGANRLLLGVGWPAVFLLSWYAGGRGTLKDIQMEAPQSVEIVFLGLATLYTFVIVAKGSLGPFDAVVLVVIFIAYAYLASRLPPHGEERMGELEGPALAVAGMKGVRRIAAMTFFVALGAAAIVFGSEPFVKSFLSVTGSLNLGQGTEYLLIQWLTPVLTELPEAVTVLYWAAKTGKGPLALASLVSSKLNQWTILISTLPIVYSIALGGLSTIALTPLQVDEVLLTASQSLFGFTCLLDLRLTKYDVAGLLGLFAVQFLVPAVRVEVSLTYVALAGLEVVWNRGRLEAFRQLSLVLGQRPR